MGQFAVIGLGPFGSATSLELMKLGHSVLGVDSDNKLFDKYADQLPHAAIADVTDTPSLEAMGLYTHAVVPVSIGEELHALLLCVQHQKRLGLNKVWGTATKTEK